MIHYVQGDLFQSKAKVLVNPVNTVGVMGKGLALEFKRRYPAMFAFYKQACDDHVLIVGTVLLWKGSDRWVLQFPTKEHWRNASQLSYIEKGLESFVNTYRELGITSVAFPKLGCGCGALAWSHVKALMEQYLVPLPIPVYVYLPDTDRKEKEEKK